MERGVCLLAADGYERFPERLCGLLPEWAWGARREEEPLVGTGPQVSGTGRDGPGA